MNVIFRLVSAILLFTILAAPASADAGSGSSTSVINGEPAPAANFPYVALVVYLAGDEGGVCTGSVVSSNVILTAAHCVSQEGTNQTLPSEDLHVITGTENGLAGGVISTVSKIATGGYLASLHLNDYAVLQLSSPIAAPPIKLAASAFWQAGTGATIVGWGRTVADHEPDLLLHYGRTAIQSSTYCHQEIGFAFDGSSELCFVDPEATYAVCNGDSGGPVISTEPGETEPVEIGIVSYGDTGCPTESPQVATRADTVVGFVGKKIAEWAPPPPAPAPTPRVTAPPQSPLTPASKVLPRMTSSSAGVYARYALLRRFRRRWSGHRRLRLRCPALPTPNRRRCQVSWESSPYSFSGYVTVSYHWRGEELVVDHSFRLQRMLCASSGCSRRLFTH